MQGSQWAPKGHVSLEGLLDVGESVENERLTQGFVNADASHATKCDHDGNSLGSDPLGPARLAGAIIPVSATSILSETHRVASSRASVRWKGGGAELYMERRGV